MRLGSIAERLQCRLEGDADVEITRVAGIEQARPGDLTFIAHAKYLAHLDSTQASAVIVGLAVPSVAHGPALLRSDYPYLAFAQAVSLFVQAAPPARGRRPTQLDRCGCNDWRRGFDRSVCKRRRRRMPRRSHHHLSQCRRRRRCPNR